MNSPATPPAFDEQKRLNALHRLHVLDTPPEAVLDALVRAAALACDVPIALISLVDKDRLWFKANVGLPGVEGLARHGSFCDQAIRGHDVLEVSDARSDAQFACAALVTEPPYIQFYAGAPIEMPDGLRMGTLCVLHREPHRLNPSQKQILRELAAAAAQVMGAETALRLSEEKFRTLSDSSPFGVYHTDANGRCTYTNAQWQSIYGLSLAESLGDNWASTLHPEDKAAVFAGWQASVDESRDFNMEFRILRGDGQVRDVKSKARAILAAGGEIGGYVGAVEDVTERRLQDKRLGASESSLNRTGRIASVGGWTVDLRSGDIIWSDQTHRIHGTEPGYRPTLEQAIAFYAPQARPVIEQAIKKGISDGRPWDVELPFVSAQGRAMWVRVYGEAEFENGRAVRLVGAFQDITEQRERQLAFHQEQALRQEIEQHAAQTENLLRERTEMLDVLAHEVRQPLHNASAALQSAEGALRGEGNDQASDRLTRAQTVFSQVMSSIDNTLTAATLLGEGLLEQTSDTDIDAFIALTVADITQTQRQRIQVQRHSSIRTVSMNMSLMRIALRNLLLNALSFSPPGSPVLLQLSDTDRPLAFLIDVTDAGPGVDPALLPRLFQRGARSTQQSQRSSHGLGLYIVRRVMELHGGTVVLHSNRPGSTCFRLALTQSVQE
jgi:PAS domain S-box-containing protein